MKSKSTFNPAETGASYRALTADWTLCDTLMGGTRAMRDAGVALLPLHVNEDDKAYRSRLEQSTLLNFFKEAIDGVTSRVFARPVVLEDNASDIFKGTACNVDRLGDNLDGFARRAFEAALVYGVSYILVDYPRIATEIEEEISGRKVKRKRT